MKEDDWAMINDYGGRDEPDPYVLIEQQKKRIAVLEADGARMDHIEAMAREQKTFLGYPCAGLRGLNFVELRRDGLLYSYDTVREATDAEMKMEAKER